ncbi:hypothetical protein DVH24_012389 [Malus domestica]|uniref:F-box domain-containing protein n=1 Tax=Malus domestica TaxID=3750 RepID=A0A498HT13_MALDO|nr:hypothetical protein DVH24_012389 [Malus domestica]
MSRRRSATAANNSRPIVGSFRSFIFFRWLSRSPFKNSKTTKKNKSSADDTSGHHQSYRTRKSDWATTVFQYLPEAKTTCFKFGGEFQYCCDLFPEEILREILLRLPSVKSIIKCSAVCRSWRYLIQTPSFIAAHLRCRLSLNGDCSLHLVRNRSHIGGYLLYWDKPAASDSGDSSGFVGGESSGSFSINSSNTKIITPLTYKSTTRGRGIEEITCSQPCYDLVGTCNGLICLANDAHFSPEVPTIIWNPSVRKFVTLPLPSIAIPDTVYDTDSDHWVIPTSAFGYDSRTGDYKVLRIFSNFNCGGAAGDTPFGVEVFSLARGSWKTLSPCVSIPGCFALCRRNPRPRHVFVNGAVHWLLPRGRHSDQFVIVSFDMLTESFGEVEMPEPLRNPPGPPPSPIISVHEEDSLALLEADWDLTRSGVEVWHLTLWVMQQYGMVDSWTNLTVTLHEPDSCPIPIGSKSNGEQVFSMTTKSGCARLLTVDFKTKRVRYSGVEEGWKYNSMDPFVESLVLLGQSNAHSFQVAAASKKQQQGYNL